MQRVSLLIGIMALHCASAHAVNLSGTVRDSANAPVTGAFVSAKPVGRAFSVNVVSDAKGHFTIPDLFAGRYMLSTSKLGFQTVEHADFNLSENGGQQDFTMNTTTATVD